MEKLRTYYTASITVPESDIFEAFQEDLEYNKIPSDMMFLKYIRQFFEDYFNDFGAECLHIEERKEMI